MQPQKFLAELKRRNVYRVAIAYAVVAWLLIQVATQVFPFFEIPNWGVRFIILAIVFGFPVALMFAWAYELTPEGLKRTEHVEPAVSITRSTGRKLDFAIISVLVAVIAVLLVSRFWPSWFSPTAELSQKSIAVLPFSDLSATQDQEYFGEGITEQLINSLAKIRGLFVVARTSVLVFKTTTQDVREVGRILGVNHVLEGSVRRGAGKVRVDARLIDVNSGYHLWSETYESAEQDLLSLQSDVAQKVASALQVELRLPEVKRIATLPTQDRKAYDQYLKGRYFLNQRTVASIQKGLALFEQAVADDPRFAAAHAGIADAYILLGQYGAITPAEAWKHGWPKASAAITLDPNLADGYTSRALLLTHFEWDWPAAERDYKRALELDPNSAKAYHWYAFHLGEVGRFEEALSNIDAARRNDPLSPIIQAAKGKILWMARRYDEAIAQLREALELQPAFAPALSILARAYTGKRQFSEAVDTAQKYVRLMNHTWVEYELAYIYSVAGDKAASDKILLEASASDRDASPYELAAIGVAKEDATNAIEWLTKAVEQHAPDVVWIRVDPRFDPIRTDPRFEGILRRMAPQRSVRRAD